MRIEVNEFLETADAIGARICRDALWAGQRCNWIGASFAPVDGNWQTVCGALGAEVYGGTAGIALFLARLSSATGNRLQRLTALGALEHAVAHVNRIPTDMTMSFYSGLLGVLYTSIAVGEVLHNDEMIATALSSLVTMASVSTIGAQLDVVSGIAGGIPALISIYRRYPRDELLRCAMSLGDVLLKASVETERGLSWPNSAMSTSNALTGFSHGTAGFAWALLELHGVTGESRFSEAAKSAFEYERSWFSEEQQNWPDLRDYGTSTAVNLQRSYGMAWCHGAPGIALSRLRALELSRDDKTVAREAGIAVSSTAGGIEMALAVPSTSNFSLCHGIAGNAEALLYASCVTGVKSRRLEAERAARAGVALYERTGGMWPGGVTSGGDNPALMLGTAGTGYFFLRLADPDGVPPVLIILADADERAMQLHG